MCGVFLSFRAGGTLPFCVDPVDVNLGRQSKVKLLTLKDLLHRLGDLGRFLQEEMMWFCLDAGRGPHGSPSVFSEDDGRFAKVARAVRSFCGGEYMSVVLSRMV